MCGYVIQPQLTHTHIFDQEKAEEAYLQKAATCTESAVYYKFCVCGEKGEGTFAQGEPLGHIWGEWAVITPATEEAEGVKQRSCQNDPQHIDQQNIPKLPARPVGPKPAEKPQETPGSGFVDVPEEIGKRELHFCRLGDKIKKIPAGSDETAGIQKAMAFFCAPTERAQKTILL